MLMNTKNIVFTKYKRLVSFKEDNTLDPLNGISIATKSAKKQRAHLACEDNR
jgi:hypothetical protein